MLYLQRTAVHLRSLAWLWSTMCSPEVPWRKERCLYSHYFQNTFPDVAPRPGGINTQNRVSSSCSPPSPQQREQQFVAGDTPFWEVCLKLLVPILFSSGQPAIGNTVFASSACSKLQVSIIKAFLNVLFRFSSFLLSFFFFLFVHKSKQEADAEN